jgi:hypothetical protein
LERTLLIDNTQCKILERNQITQLNATSEGNFAVKYVSPSRKEGCSSRYSRTS